jgi:hypothetical protein
MTHPFENKQVPFIGFLKQSFLNRQSNKTLDMETLAAKISNIARPFVKRELVMETMHVAAEAWNEEAVQALSMLLRENHADLPDDGVIKELQVALEKPSEPDDEEIREHADEVGGILASAWLQFLSFALESRKMLFLNQYLLPGDDQEVEPDLWEALQNSLNSFAIGWETVPSIMKRVGEELFAKRDMIGFPLGISIQKEDVVGYIARMD